MRTIIILLLSSMIFIHVIGLLHQFHLTNKAASKPINPTVLFLFSMIFMAYLGYQLGGAF